VLKIWGRNNGMNVIKTMWCIGELGLEYERVDWAGSFGGNDDPQYRAMNPTGRVPTIREDDGYTLWESGAIIRYLAEKHDFGGLYPADLRVRAEANKWMDWNATALQQQNRHFVFNLIRRAPADCKPDEIAAATEAWHELFAILDRHLADRPYVAGDAFSMGDIPVGATTYRYHYFVAERPDLPHLDAWYKRLQTRPAYREHAMITPGW